MIARRLTHFLTINGSCASAFTLTFIRQMHIQLATTKTIHYVPNASEARITSFLQKYARVSVHVQSLTISIFRRTKSSQLGASCPIHHEGV